MATTWATRSQSPPTKRGRQAIGHAPPARTESLARTPDVGPPEAVKDDVDAIAREAVNFCHEVLMLVINRDTAQVGDGRRPRDEHVPYIVSPARRPSCNSAEPTPPAAPCINT